MFWPCRNKDDKDFHIKYRILGFKNKTRDNF